MTLDLHIHPSRGSHRWPSQGACTMECEVLIHGHTWREVVRAGDLPASFSPVIGDYVIRLQDVMPDDARHLLEPLFGRLGENRGTPEEECARTEYLVMHAAKTAAVVALRAIGLDDHADDVERAATLQELIVAERASWRTGHRAMAVTMAVRLAAQAASGAREATEATPTTASAKAVAYVAYAVEAAEDVTGSGFDWRPYVAALEGALTIGPQAPPVDPRLAWERTRRVRE